MAVWIEAGLLVLLLGTVVLCGVELRRHCAVTLYSYRNIMLVSMGLFLLCFAAVTAVALVRSLSAGDVTTAEVYRDILAFPRSFSYYALFVIAVICAVGFVSNVALIRHEGFRIHNLLSIFIAVSYYLLTAVCYTLADLLAGADALPASAGALFFRTALPLFILVVLCYGECLVAGIAVMGWIAARQVPKHDKDYIIILGCSVDPNGGLLPLLRGRVNRAMRFAWEQETDTGKPLCYVPSGGKGTAEVMSEGSAMELYLLTRGAERDEVYPEKESRTTHENFLFSKKVIDALDPNATVAFATTNFHMLRSGIYARRAGIDAEGIAGDTKWYYWPNGFMREFFALVAMHWRAHLVIAAVLAVLSAAVALIGCLGIL